MGFEKDTWNEADDGSAMKVTDDGTNLKTETITSTDRPHEHIGSVVNRPTGNVEQFYVGENSDPGGKGGRS